jgi:hypothetical protein
VPTLQKHVESTLIGILTRLSLQHRAAVIESRPVSNPPGVDPIAVLTGRTPPPDCWRIRPLNDIRTLIRKTMELIAVSILCIQFGVKITDPFCLGS